MKPFPTFSRWSVPSCLVLACPLTLPPSVAGQSLSTNVISGSISVPGERDTFTFSLDRRARFYFDALTNLNTLNWSLEGPTGALVTDRAFPNSDAGSSSVMSLVPGFHRLTIDCDAANTNRYLFRFLDLAAATLLTPGTVVSNTLSPGNETDFYQFESAAGDRLTFDRLTSLPAGNVWWRLIDAYGNEVFSTPFNDVNNVTQRVTGTYTLLIEGYPGNTAPGPYSFSVVPLGHTPPTPFSGTPMSLGAIVSGSLTNASTNDFTFTLGEKTRVVFDTLTNSSAAQWSLEGPPGTVVNNQSVNGSDGQNGVPLLELPAGDYRLRLRRTTAGVSPYRFRLFDVSGAATVTPDVPVLGVLPALTTSDAYQFSASAGSRFYFDLHSTNGTSSTEWRLFDPFGTRVAQATIRTDRGPMTFTVSGTYTLLVEGYWGDTTGNPAYRFDIVPVEDGVQTLALGALTTGAISVPGQNQQYLFTLGTAAWLYFDSRTADNQLRWSLQGPAGALVDNRGLGQSDGANAYAVFDLPAGDYAMTFTGNADTVGAFAFRLFDVAGATPVIPGAPIAGVLSPGNETDAYRFTVAPGTRVYFDAVASSGAPGIYWRCVDRFGNVVLANSHNDLGPVMLEAGGTYTLLIEGHPTDLSSGTYTVNVVPIEDGQQSLAIGGLVNGAIASPGQSQHYAFSLPAPALLYFDSRTDQAGLRWSLEGPSGILVANREFNNSDANTGLGALSLPSGGFTLMVRGNGSTTGEYQFRLFDLSTATPATPGSPINGTLDPANETDAYRFTVAGGSRVYFDFLSKTGLPSAYWRCVDPSGATLFGNLLSDHGPIVLPVSGVYNLLVEGYRADTGSGTYSVNVVPVTDGEQSLTLGSVVSGAISMPGQEQRHVFSLAAPATLYFDSHSSSPLRATLTGPDGVVFANRPFAIEDRGQPLLRLNPGDYVLAVRGVADATGAYQFRLFDLATATPLTPGALAGATLDPGSETDAYRFTAGAGDRFFFDWISRTGIQNAYWQLFDPYGSQVFGAFFSSDAGTNRLLADGSYLLLIEGDNSDAAAGAYQFNVIPVDNVPVPPFTGTPLVPGATISSNLPAATTTNAYVFALAAPARLFFDSLVSSSVAWSLDGPPGRLVDSRAFSSSDSADGNARLDLPAGEYRLTVTGAAGAYSFRLLDVADATPITPGTVFSGSVAPGRATVLHRFAAGAGDQFYFDGQPAAGFSTAPYTKLYDPYGNLLFSQGAATDADVFTFPHSGVYVLSIEGRHLDTGTNGSFSFLLQPVTDGTNAFAVGEPVQGTIAHPGQRQFHQFTLGTAAVLFFDTLSASGFPWTLTGAAGVVVNNRAFWISDSVDGNSRLDLPAGEYVIEVDPTGAATGDYAFRLLDSSSALPFTPGALVGGSLTPGNSTRLYRFHAAAGSRFYFDGRPVTGFSVSPYARLHSPLGNLVLNNQVLTGDEDVFTVPQTGDYLLAVEGRYLDTSASGEFSFLLQPVSDGTNTFAVGEIVNGAITHPGQRQFHRFTLDSPAVLFFDTLSASRFPWTLTGPAGDLVNGRALWSSDSIDGNPRLDLPAGEYVIMVDPSGAVTGEYAFRLLDASSSISFTPGTVVSGSLAPANSTLLYRFAAAAGGRFYFDGLPVTGFALAPYVRIYAPLGNLVLNNQVVTGDEDVFTVLQGGDYLLSVEGRYQDASPVGNFSFLLAPSPVVPPVPLFDTNTAPDLRVSGVVLSPSAGLQSGQSLTVSWSTRNDGNAATSGSFTERVSVRNLSSGQIVASRTLLSDETLVGPILPGQPRNRQLIVTLPDGPMGAGNLEVTVTTDALNDIFEQNSGGTAEANNAATVNAVSTLAPYPDLLVAALGSTPPSGWGTGSVVTVTWAVTNSGTRATSGSWTDSLLVRNTNTAQIVVNTTVPYDAAEPGLGDIPPGESRERSATFVMPMNASAYGAFEVVVTTDSDNAVFEHNPGDTAENNNTRSFVSASAPDLLINGLNVTGNPALEAGAQLIVQWNIGNQGNVQAHGAFYDRVTVRNTNTAEVLVNTSVPYNPATAGNGPIPPGGSKARRYQLTLPDGARGVGRLEITVTADVFDQIPEDNPGGTGEANNVARVEVTVAPKPYPDLLVTSVSGPATALPGQSVPVVWTLRNNGPASATGSWSDHLFLSVDPVNGGDQFLVSVPLTGTLNPNESLTRTQQVSMPAFGTGARYFVVKTDAGDRVFEENEGNNAGVAGSPVQVAAALTLALAPGSVFENAGSQATLATLTRNSSAASTLDVTLSANPPGGVAIAAAVQFPAGASSVSFPVGVVDDLIVGSDVTVTLVAQAAGHLGATNSLNVRENDSPALRLQLGASTVVENAPAGTLTGRVLRNVNTNLALTVTLSTDRPGALSLPATVIIPTGQLEAMFAIDPIDDDLVTGPRSAALYASASGFANVSVPLTILDDDTVTLTLVLSQTNVSENAVNPAAVATVSRSPVSSGLLRVRLGTNGGSLAQIPAEVVIPAGQPAVQFNINVRDDQLAYGSQSVNIVAQGEASNGSSISGASAAATIHIQENDGPTLRVEPAIAVIAEGSSTMVRILRNTPPTNSLTVSLDATPAGQATLPASVVIATGLDATNVMVQGVNDGVSDGAREVTVTASAAGFNSGSAPITVTDIDVADLVVTEISVPTNGLTDGLVTAVWTVTNSGLAIAMAPWVDELYLAKDAQGADAQFLTRVTNNLPVAVGDSYTVARSFLLPADPGMYWLVARTDTGGAVIEGSERNNALVSVAVVVQPGYRATVSTDVDTAISGTPIALSGRTFFSSNGAPAPFRLATVRVSVRQTRRTFSVLSDANGNFSGVFQPIPGEAGVYTIGADHPRVREDAVQDQFTLLGMAAMPWDLDLRLAPDLPAAVRLEIRNLSPVPLTGLSVTPEGLPLDFAVTTAMTNHLGGNGTNQLDVAVVTSLTTPVRGRFDLLVTSIEGAVLRVPVDFTVAPAYAQLVAEPAVLEHGMLRGTQTLVQFDVVNQGGADSGELSVALPVVPWMSLVSTTPIPSLAPGGRATLVLALSPPADLPLTRYDGTLVLRGTDTSATVPFHFRALSEARGDVVLTMTDAHTYYADGAPKVTNATVVLRDPITSDVVTNGISDATGQVRFTDLPEGLYVIEASAPRHSPVRAGVTVSPGTTTELEVFLMRQEVTYEWRVVPSEIEDHYRVVLQPLFETEVPQPNLVVENPIITPLIVPGRVSQFAIRLRNNGLIALERVRIPVPNHPAYEITPLVTEIAVLPALTSVSVPVTMRVRSGGSGGAEAGNGFQPAAGPGCPGDDCVIQLPINTGFRCGNNFVTMTAQVSLHAVCVPDTGCDFSNLLDTSSPTFFSDSLLADRAAWDCALGNMDECDKARVRGYLKSGDLGSLYFPPGVLPPPLDGMNFGLSAFCVCGPQSSTNTIFALGTNFLNRLGFPNTGGAGSTFSFVSATIPGPCNAPFAPASSTPAATAGAGPGVCARVRLELSQDITMTRTAFRGTLVFDNGGVTDITGIQLDLDFRDAASQPAGSRFAVRGPTLTGITAVDGSGVLAAGTSGSVDYVFVPTLEAAPLAPAAYQIGGTLRFTLDGQALTVPLLPGQITVLPDARLQLEYFQQRDVYSDDPFTPELEPAEPFALGLRIHNIGAGIARSFRIASAAPRIIENDKGLAIDFQLLGARIDDQPFTPSFNLNVGDIQPGQSRIVVWDMTSTLQGKFIDYRASFVHVDAFGSTNTSLIDGVAVHELIHVVRDDRTGADALPDFLVNDTPDPDNLPDIVYLSDGAQAPVGLGANPVLDGAAATNHLQVQLTVAMPAGFSYLRLTNPGPDFRLTGVQRSDGRTLRVPENAWTTDRTFPSSQTGAVREKLLHLFDYDSTGSYTLHFAPLLQDTNPPTSVIAALPSVSAGSFALEWDGDDGPDGSGVAFFDVFVSVEGGPFTNWLSRTMLRSALFDGVAEQAYAFYSLATDRAGNQELAPVSPDAQTRTAAGANTPPAFIPIAGVTIDEGTSFILTPTAFDGDLPRQSLTFALLGAPAGATLEPVTGRITWLTSETHGGTSNEFTVAVADSGLPSLSVTQSFLVIVREVNSPPFFLDATGAVEVNEETTLSFVVAASDPDLPPNQLRWELGSGAPAGMSISPSTGVLTWMPDETHGPGEQAVEVTVSDNGDPSRSATRLLRVIVREVNRPPALAPIPIQAALIGTPLMVTNSATDPDVPPQQFTFSLAPGAPRGARIDRTNGVFTWTPTPAYARTTNAITVRVTDTGVPSLTDSRILTVIVGDYLEVRLGRSVVPGGQTGSVPVRVFTTVPATNAGFVIEVPSDRLTNLRLAPPGPPLTSANLQALGDNRFQVSLDASPSTPLAGEQLVLHLEFDALPDRVSAFVPLLATNVSATQVNGQVVPRATGSPGRVVYLGAQPLLEIVREDEDTGLIVYGRAAAYTIESTASLTPVVEWMPFWRGPLKNLMTVIPLSPTLAPIVPARFFRAAEGDGGRARFTSVTVDPRTQEVRLTLAVEAGRAYEIQHSSDLVNWTRLVTTNTTSSVWTILDAVPGVGHRFYRAFEQ